MKNILIFKKLVEKYFKKYIKKYNKYFEYYKICRKPKPKPFQIDSVFYYLPIYHLLIITIPDLEFLAVPNSALLVV